ncbi:MAG: tRNA dimethylallyltransferase [Candidatus Kentron sp. G]|nr:MAG: tRNA dimethylallyltransferase [Candidatus Kentron sp. G]VFN02107.1 MAG: tRNA dimethylallyltransferase [Candidatus Kentron sp. G]VFN04316.1 MAG: tRNA dimethylallyltransferase [Candidatus Kentron sp. G]
MNLAHRPIRHRILAVVGPTASGKSDYAVQLARLFDGEIVSADSRQVYRRLNLGTGKITHEEMLGIPHHLIDIIDPGEDYSPTPRIYRSTTGNNPLIPRCGTIEGIRAPRRYSLFDFQRDAYSAMESIAGNKRLPIIAGGTGLYVAAVVEGYELLDVKPDPVARQELEERSMDQLIEIIQREQPGALEAIGARTKRRLIRAIEVIRAGFDYKDTRKKSGCLDALMIGVQWEKAILHRRIRERLYRRLEQGMIEEVQGLRANGVPDRFLFAMGLEYRAILQYLQGGYPSRQHFIDHLESSIRQFAKRQMTWFRGRPGITWVAGADLLSPLILDRIRSFLKNESSEFGA